MALIVVVSTAVALGGCSGDDRRHDVVDDVLTTSTPDTDVSDGGDVAVVETTVAPDVETRDTTTVDSVASDVDASTDVDAIEAPSTGYPAEGLLVRILGPGAHGRAELAGSVAIVSGLLFGNAQTMLWQAGAQSGTMTPQPFWQTGPIQLSPGDNTVTVTAVDGATVVSQAIVITYNPGFRFDDVLVGRPAVLWTGTPTEVVFTIPSALYGAADPNSIRLQRVTAEGEILSDQGPMRDDGLLSASGDEIDGDGVFTGARTLTCATAGPMYFRAVASVDVSPSYTAVSSLMRIDCLAHVSVATCSAHRSIIDAAGAALDGGTDLASVVAQLAADGSVAAAGPAEGGHAAWVEFDDGLLGAVLTSDFAATGNRGGLGASAASLVGAELAGATSFVLGSTRALVLSPFASELGPTDEGAEVAALLDATQCPRYEVESGGALTDAAASIARFRTIARYGVVSIATHGATLFGGDGAAERATRHAWAHAGAQEVLWTGSAVSCDNLLQDERSCVTSAEHPDGVCPLGSRCLVTKGTASDAGASGEGVCVDDTQADLRLGRALITNRGYAVTPSFFSAWRDHGLPGSYVHLGACDSMRNGSLASALYAAGAQAVSGFSGPVASAWAHDRALDVFAHVGEPGTIDDFHVPAIDPANPTTRSRLIGATTLVLDASDLRNASFEVGSVEGWDTEGDGRVLVKFGQAAPINGKHMGVVSTGLGYSVETGSMSQTFCIAPGKREIGIWWRYYSEEFREWCGSDTYQDRFAATLTNDVGAVLPLVKLATDDLCQYDDGTCSCADPIPCDAHCFGQDGCYLTEDQSACVGHFNCKCGRYYESLAESDLDFELPPGGVYETQWRHTVVDVSSLAGQGPVTLRFEVEDGGDSLYDTAVLIDAIEIE